MSDDSVGTRKALEERSTEELVSILEKRDLGEWRPEVFEIAESILLGRGLFPGDVSHLGGQMREGQEGEEEGSLPQGPLGTPPPGYTQVAGGRGPVDAEKIAEQLGHEGIPFFLDARHGRHSNIKVYVPGEDWRTARTILERSGLIPAQAPDTEAPVGVAGGPCPACGAVVPAESVECPECKLALG